MSADTLVTLEFLQRNGFQDRGLRGMSILLPPHPDGKDSAIAELFVDLCEDETCYLAIGQGVPDDPKVSDDLVCLTSMPSKITEARLYLLCHCLGVTLKAGVS